MCGRFSLTADELELKQRFGIEIAPGIYQPRYNAAPSQNLAVISNDRPDTMSFYRWGLIPFWAKDASIGYKLINARAETAAEKVSFKQALKKRRCLVPASGFFEWKLQGYKQPYYFQFNKQSIFSFAGLWERWKDAQGQEVRTFTILTTRANEMMRQIHHRMPVILIKETEHEWLKAENPNFSAIFKPTSASLMSKYPVSIKVNKPENDTPDILTPQNENGTLF